MRPEDHQNQWFNFGVVLFGGGTVVSADWVFAIKSAPAENGLSFAQWPVALWIVMMAAGGWIMLASYQEHKFFWLPGKGRVRRSKEQRIGAEAAFSIFLLAGSKTLVRGGTDEQVREWAKNLMEYVLEAWGTTQMSALVLAIDETPLTAASVGPLNSALGELGQRLPHIQVLEEFEPDGPHSWSPYIQKIDREVKELQKTLDEKRKKALG
jgi:hypothetical protein